jgi:hypothetical protein
VTSRGQLARQGLTALGIGWGPDTATDLNAAEGPIVNGDASDAIRQAADDVTSGLN